MHFVNNTFRVILDKIIVKVLCLEINIHVYSMYNFYSSLLVKSIIINFLHAKYQYMYMYQNPVLLGYILTVQNVYFSL